MIVAILKGCAIAITVAVAIATPAWLLFTAVAMIAAARYLRVNGDEYYEDEEE